MEGCMRLIINLFLIILIVFSLSIIPINQDLFDLDLPSLGEEQPVDEETESIEEYFNIGATSPQEELLENNELELIFSTSNRDELETIIDTFNIEFINLLGEKTTYPLKDIPSSFIIKTDDISVYNEDYSGLDVYSINYTFYLKNLDLSSNYYQIKLTSSHEKIPQAYSYEVSYLNSKTYIGSSQKPPESRLFTKIYYPDAGFLRLVPIHKVIDDGSKFIPRTIDELNSVIDEKYGLSNTVVAPKVDNIWVTNGVARIDMKSEDVEAFSTGSATSQFALNSIIKTISEFDIVREVKFFVDNSDTGDFFHGTDLTDTFKVTDGPKAYVGLETSENYSFLYPIDINKDALNEKISTIFNTLKNGGMESVATQNLIPTLPQDVSILNYRFDGKNIELDLSEEFLTAFNNQEDYQLLMYDSLLYSLTSIEGINTVSILINGEQTNDFMEIPISTPQKPNKFINTLD